MPLHRRSVNHFLSRNVQEVKGVLTSDCQQHPQTLPNVGSVGILPFVQEM